MHNVVLFMFNVNLMVRSIPIIVRFGGAFWGALLFNRIVDSPTSKGFLSHGIEKIQIRQLDGLSPSVTLLHAFSFHLLWRDPPLSSPYRPLCSRPRLSSDESLEWPAELVEGF